MPLPTAFSPMSNSCVFTFAPGFGISTTPSMIESGRQLVHLEAGFLQVGDRVRHDRDLAALPLGERESLLHGRMHELPRLREVLARDRGEDELAGDDARLGIELRGLRGGCRGPGSASAPPRRRRGRT